MTKYRKEQDGWPVGVNVRLRRIAPLEKPDNAAIWSAFEQVVQGTVPAGWEVAAVSWQGYVRRGGRFHPGDGSSSPDPQPYTPLGKLGPVIATGWRKGDVSELAPLIGPIFAGTVEIGWEKRRRRVLIEQAPSWGRWRSVGTRTKARSQYVSNAYAERYPHLVYRTQKENKPGVKYVTDYEAEVRVHYEP